MIRKKAIIRRCEVVRDYKPEGDLNPINVLLDCDYEEDES